LNRILVTGATGFLGSHLLQALVTNGFSPIPVSSKDYDLLNYNEVEKCLQDTKPDAIVHLAGISGGIGANIARPEIFYYKNTLLTAHMFQAASTTGIQRMIFPMGGCSYPSTAVSPIDESQMWNGYPHGASSAYSSAKKMGIVAGQAYQKTGLKTTVIVPGNMYGEFDNFSSTDSHVIPAIIRKVYEAKNNISKQVNMWGTGCPVRDFVYAGDVAKIICKILPLENLMGPLNISTGTSVSIRDVTYQIANIMNYEAEINWDSTKPEGQLVKIFETTYLKSLGLECETLFDDGIKKTINWFEANYHKKDIIRL
jgi:GDP-L-fucose synthase